MPYWKNVKNIKKDLEDLPVSAKLVLLTSDGKVLVMRKNSGLYDIPGGKVELGEDLYEALRREVYEETGLKAKKLSFASSWVKNINNRGNRLVLVFETRKKRTAKELKAKMKLSDEHEWAKFLTWKEVQKLDDMQAGYAHAIDMCFHRY